MGAVGDEVMESGMDPTVLFIKTAIDQLSSRVDEQNGRIAALERKLDAAAERNVVLAEALARNSPSSDARPPLIPVAAGTRPRQNPLVSNPPPRSFPAAYPVGAGHAAFQGSGRGPMSPGPYAVLDVSQMVSPPGQFPANAALAPPARGRTTQ